VKGEATVHSFLYPSTLPLFAVRSSHHIEREKKQRQLQYRYKGRKMMKPYPTYVGTYSCASWPTTPLVDMNQVYYQGDNIVNRAYTLDDLPGHANATVVGLFFAD